MPHILAIDQSTSATKAILFDDAGNVVRKASREHRQIYPQPGWVEHDAEEIWNNTRAALDEVMAQNPAAQRPACLSVTNQRETVVVFDRATGKPLHNAIVWQCRRGAEMCDQLVHDGYAEMVTGKTGLKVDTYFSASKITWLMKNRPEIAAKLRDGSAVIGTIDTYLIHRLTNGKVFATDHSNASRTLLFDINAIQWDSKLCELFGVPMIALPGVRDSTAQFGEVALRESNEKMVTVPIFGVMGDSQASLFAHRCYQPGAVKVTIGTGSSLMLNTGGAPQPGGDAAVSTVAWTHGAKATYCFEGIINYSAATVEWLRNQLGIIQNASESEAMATSVADNGGVYLVPAFAGLSAPYWSPAARAAIVGLTGAANKNHIVRAALESIAYQIHDVLEAMKRQAKVEIASIHADGGAIRNVFLMQFIADITNVAIAAADVSECSPLGAAMAGMLGVGLCRSFDDLARTPRSQKVYRPSMPPAQRAQLIAGWRRAMKQVLAGV